MTDQVNEAVAWIEHHKAGDNLCWENPGGNATPLYAHPSRGVVDEVAERRALNKALDALDALSERWASEIGLDAMCANLAKAADVPAAIRAMAVQAWVEGAYAGRTSHQAPQPDDQHPDDVAVDRFAAAMKAKLAEARAKGRGGWHEPDLQQRLSDMLREHVDKGDPRDVANFACFLFNRGEAIAPAAMPAVPEATMFWNAADNERACDSIDELLNDEWGNGYLEVGQEFTIQRAERWSDIRIRVTKVTDDGDVEYEELAATPAHDQPEGEG